QVARRGLHFHLRLARGGEGPAAEMVEGAQVNAIAVGAHRTRRAFDQVLEVVTSFAGAKVDAHVGPLDAIVVEQPRVFERLAPRGQREARVEAAGSPAFGSRDESTQVEILHL